MVNANSAQERERLRQLELGKQRLLKLNAKKDATENMMFELLGNKSNDELEELVVRYAQNITAFSQLANVSRDQIAAIIKSSTAVEAFTNKLNFLQLTNTQHYSLNCDCEQQ